jgi:hypothetical protein
MRAYFFVPDKSLRPIITTTRIPLGKLVLEESPELLLEHDLAWSTTHLVVVVVVHRSVDPPLST